MKIGILQPGYLPWLGFFEQIYRSDLFVIYDDVQYDKHGWRNRNRIKTANGIQWLTVPVHISLKEPLLIKEVRIDNKQSWAKKHLLSIKQNYVKAPFYKNYRAIVEEAYSHEWEFLIDIDMYFIERLMEAFGIHVKTITRSSSLGIEGGRIERLIKICKNFGADVFYEGTAGKNYIEDRQFAQHGITVEYQDYKHPVYRQLYGDFVSHLSAIDLLFNHGPESLSILTSKKTLEVSQ
jgi:hypothetical protein